MQSLVCLLYNLYNTNEFILRMTLCLRMTESYPHVIADLFLFCNERNFIISHSDDTGNQSDVNEAFNSISR